MQQHHMTQLQAALEEKEQQLNQQQNLFDRLKQDFKYNLRLLQERDTELEQMDVSLSELRTELDRQMNLASQLGVNLVESEKCCQQLEENVREEQTARRQQIESERVECDRRLSNQMSEHNQQKLQWESEKRALQQNLQV